MKLTDKQMNEIRKKNNQKVLASYNLKRDNSCARHNDRALDNPKSLVLRPDGVITSPEGYLEWLVRQELEEIL